MKKIMLLTFFLFLFHSLSATTPSEAATNFIKEIKEKDASTFFRNIYWGKKPMSMNNFMQIDKRYFEQYSTPILTYINPKCIGSKIIGDYAVVTYSKLLKTGKTSPQLISIYLLKSQGIWKISPCVFDPIPLQDTNYKEAKKTFKKLEEWFKKKQTDFTKNLVQKMKVNVAHLPFSIEISLKKGDAVKFVFPDNKTLSTWVTAPRGFAKMLTDSNLSLSYGEEPFVRLKSEKINLPSGGCTFGDYLSYIRSGSTITSSGHPYSTRILFIDKYKISLKETKIDSNEITFIFTVNQATPLEQVRNKDKLNFLFKQLETSDPAQQIKIIKYISGDLALGNMYFTPRKKEILEKIRPLSKSDNNKLRDIALQFLSNWGASDLIWKQIYPYPKEKDLTHQGAIDLSSATQRSDSKDKICKHALTFFESKKPKLVNFASYFFCYIDYPPSFPFLIKNLNNENMSEEVRATIMSSIRLKCKDETVISEINKILAQKSPPAQILIEALRVGNWYTDKLNQENLFKHTESNDPKVREMAAYALDCSTNPKAMAPLFKLTEDPVPGVRAQAAATLGRFFIQAKPEKDKIYKKLLSMLEDKNPDVRYDAVNALRNFGDKKAISNLIKLQEHEKDKSVLRIIKRTIRELKDFH